jgi:ligand-binding sensor domain-containing protein
MRISFVFSLLFLFTALSSFSQQHNFKKYAVESGIQSQVKCITQDKRGYIWIGTANGGVALFDGSKFTFFSKENGLSNNNVSALCEDKQGNIWIGSNNGIDRYDGKQFTHFTLRDTTFPEGDIVKNIICRKNGELWVSTEDGIKIFDGKSFSWLGKKIKLSHRKVAELFEDSKGNIWIGYKRFKSDGIDKYDGTTTTHFVISDLGGDLVTAFTEDKNGIIWVGSFNPEFVGGSGRLFFQDGEGFSQFKSPLKTDVNDLIKSRRGSLWIGTNSGLIKLSGSVVNNPFEKGKMDIGIQYGARKILGRSRASGTGFDTVFMFDYFTTKYGLPNDRIECVFEDREGNMWFGTDYGIVKYSDDAFLHFGEKEGLKNAVSAIGQDKEGKMWTGSFFFYEKRILKNDSFVHMMKYSPEFEKARLGAHFLNASDGTMWMTTMDNKIVSCNGTDLKFITAKDGLRDFPRVPVYEDKKKNIWFRAWHEGLALMRYNPDASSEQERFFCYPDSGKNKYNIVGFTVDRNETAWICIDGLGLYRLDLKNNKQVKIGKEEGLDDWNIRSFFEDQWGNLWMNPWSAKGIYRYAENKFTFFNSANGLTNSEITCIAEDGLKNVWFGTDGDGVFVYNGKDFRNYTVKDGLNNSTIMSFVNDNAGNMWVGTNKGINKISLDEKGLVRAIKKYGYSEGFIGIECNQNSAFKDASGCLWFGTSSVLTKYDPREDVQSASAPLLSLSGVSMFYEAVDWKTYSDSVLPWNLLAFNPTLPYNKNHFSFSFVGISHRSPESVRYKFMLEGADTSWSRETEKNEITYSNLSPGKYIFRVKAKNGDGVWTESAETFSFEILYPWWRTWTAYFVYVFAGAASIYSFIRYRTKKLEAEKRKLEETVKERTHQLEKQKELVEEKNKEVTDSIRYASRIQRALITSEQYINKHLKLRNKT